MLNKDANLEIELDFDVYGAIADSGLELVDLDAAAST